jgi:hypothetical protein
MKTIKLSGKYANGRVALVDDEDFPALSAYTWRAWMKRLPSGKIVGPYARRTVYMKEGRRGAQLMHTAITGWPMVDHINHDGIDNRRENLRPATIAQNNHNQRPRMGHSSRYKGVTWNRQRSKWQAAIKVKGENRYLGMYISEEEAALAYNAAALEAYGEYAYVNKISAA